MQTPILDAALAYAALGYRVIPLKPGSKVPDLRHWPEEASSDPDVVARHFRASYTRAGQHDEPNVGIVTGNGLAVLDIDKDHGGKRPAWAPDTLTVQTASGGYHFYYAVDRPVPNSVGRLALGVDVRGERGQVAAPPSVINTDRPVNDTTFERWISSYKLIYDRPIAKIDAELLIPEDVKQDFGGRGLRFEYRDEVPVGQRNNYLTSLAGYLFANGDVEAEVLDSLKLEVARLKFTPRTDEVEQIVRSVARYHVGHPSV